MQQKITGMFVAGAILLGGAALLSITQVSAQDQPPRPPQPGPMQPAMGGQFRGGMATMTASGNFLYILQGSRLLKVNTDEMRVVRETEIPQLRMAGPQPGGPGMMPGGEPRRGGGANRGGGPQDGG